MIPTDWMPHRRGDGEVVGYLREAGEAYDDDPVDEVERVERELGRHRRQPEADEPAKQAEVGDERQPPALVDREPRQEGHG